MIFSSIYAATESLCYPKGIQKALDFLKDNDFTTMEPGRFDLDGNDIYATLMDAATKPKDEVRPESHREYIDVQYVVSGTEKLGFVNDTGKYKPIEHPEGSDIYFYGDVKNESFVVSTPGCFSVFFPEDIHRPCVCVEQSENIRKVVVKIRVTAL